MNVEIPLDLIEQLHKGNVVPFVGAGVSVGTHGQRGLPSGSDLAAKLADRCGYAEGDLSLPKVAQYYEMKLGQHSLVSYIQECVDDPQYTPLLTHQLIARLPFKVIITTNWDRLLERAFEAISRPYTLVVRNEEITYLDPEKVTLVKMHGSIEQPDSLVITVDDYWDFFSQLPTVSSVLKAEFATKTLLFIGYSLEDDNFQRLYTDVTREVDRHKRRAYAIQWRPSDYAIEWWRRKEVQIIEADATEFLRELETKLDEFRAKAEGIAKPIPPEEIKLIPKRPYKFLDYFEEGDEDIFFGREKEIAELCSKVVSHRLVVLSGRSGVGKTSLLLAGVGARLRREGYTLAHVRLLADPTQELMGAVYRALEESTPAPEGDEFYSYLQVVTADLETPLIICLDQFEEFFIRQGQAVRESFARQLGRCVADGDLLVKFVIAVRADFLGELGTLQAQVPSLFNNVYTLAPLTEAAARQAIVEPARRYGVNYEAQVMEKLLRALEKEGVEPPQLQIVCDRLYDERDARGQITLARYEELGGAEGILAGHLERVLDERFAPDERSLAEAVLKALVTSLATKAVSTLADVQREAGGEEEAVASVLTRLEAARLVRRVATEQGVGYELAHEYLVDRIGGWIDAEERALKKVRELLRRAVANWQSHGLLMDVAELDLLDPHRERLHRLDPMEQELLLHSALVAGHEASAYWLKHVEDETQRAEMARHCLADGRMVVRGWTAQVLSAWDAPAVSEMLVGVTLSDDATLVRQQAAESLRTMASQREAVLTSLLAAAQGPDREQRHRALEALSYMPLGGVSLGLRMQVLATRLRLRAARFYERTLRPNWKVAVGIASVPALALVAAYIFLASSFYITWDKTSHQAHLQHILIRSGHPALRFLPGYDKVVVEAEFILVRMRGEKRNEVWNESLTGFWWQRDPYPRWWHNVVDGLEPADAGLIGWEAGTSAPLLTALTSRDPAVREEAAWVFQGVELVDPDLAVEAVPTLQQALGEGDPEVRQAAAWALGQLGPGAVQAVPALQQALEEDKYPEVRQAAAWALGQLGPGAVQAIPALQQAFLGDEHPHVRRAAAQALGQIGQEKPEIVMPALQQALKEDDVRWAAARALGQIGQEKPEVVVPALQQALEEDEKGVCVAAAEALGQIGPGAVEAVPALQRALEEDKYPILHQVAARALGQIGPGAVEAVPTLQQALEEDESPYVRQAAAQALGQIGPGAMEAVPALQQALGDEEFYVRPAAARALGQIGQEKPEIVMPALQQALKKEDPDVSRAAARALGQIGPGAVEAVPTLQQALEEDEYPGVCQAAAQALGQIGPGAVEAVPTLQQALKEDEDGDVRLAAAKALGQIGQEKPEIVMPALQQALKEDEDGDVRQAAAEALGQIGQERLEVVVPALRQALEEDKFLNVRQAAAQALSRLYGYQAQGQEIPLAFLLAKLRDPLNCDERSMAAPALFLLVLAKPDMEDETRQALRGLQDPQQPHVYAVASRTLAMLDVADLLQEAQAHPENLEEISERLARYEQLSEDYFPHLRFAAEEVRGRLEEIMTDQNTE